MENHPFLWRWIRRVRRIQVCMARKVLTNKEEKQNNQMHHNVGKLDDWGWTGNWLSYRSVLVSLEPYNFVAWDLYTGWIDAACRESELV